MKTTKNIYGGFGALIEAQGGEGTLAFLKKERAEFQKILEEFGAVLFRGFSLEIPEFVEFTNDYCDQFLQNGRKSLRPIVSEEQKVFDVVPGNDDIPLHGEMYASPAEIRPDLLWIMCKKPSSVGGQTTLCDGRELYSKISLKLKDFFAHQRLKFYFCMDREIWSSQLGTDNLNEAAAKFASFKGVQNVKTDTKKETIEFLFFCPLIRQSRYGNHTVIVHGFESILRYAKNHNEANVVFENGKPIEGSDILAELREVSESCTKNVDWRSGDLVMVDNSRLMHGRRSFQGERKMLSRFGKAS